MSNYAYVGGDSGLLVIDVSDPANCVLLGGYRTFWAPWSVAASGNYAYVGEPGAGLQVIDVRDPANCVRVGGFVTGGIPFDVVLSGRYAYIAAYGEGLQVIDVSDPTNCVYVGGYDTTGLAGGVAVSGNYAYVADGDAGLQVIDVSNPTNCVRVGGGNTSGYANDVAVSGNYAYVAEGRYDHVAGRYRGWFEVIDASNPTNCVRLGGYETSETSVANAVAVSGNYAYVAEQSFQAGRYRGTLAVIDVRNPTNCVRAGGYDTGGRPYGVAVVANRIYVADYDGGLCVLPTIPNVQFTVRVEATPGVPFTIEAATDFSSPMPWSPLLTTNVPAMPFDFVDYDVRIANKPRKFYRVRQP